ncbi:hypothetical protein TNCV_103371 [Trichonephila clavipes]|nr:hypothetical protein TNCV_103371 [Trichonephila clavipes]
MGSTLVPLKTLRAEKADAREICRELKRPYVGVVWNPDANEDLPRREADARLFCPDQSPRVGMVRKFGESVAKRFILRHLPDTQRCGLPSTFPVIRLDLEDQHLRQILNKTKKSSQVTLGKADGRAVAFCQGMSHQSVCLESDWLFF